MSDDSEKTTEERRWIMGTFIKFAIKPSGLLRDEKETMEGDKKCSDYPPE